ncbi:MAG: hypothetical protein M0P01_02705 [Treponema sp.]|nr:hypothetical protein [Treponema sp.]
MTDIEKFRSDIHRIIKRERIQNGGRYDAAHVCRQAADLLVRSVRIQGELPRSIADYWLSQYIETSVSAEKEPTDIHIDKLGAMMSFLSGSAEDGDLLSDDDWTEIGRLTGYEAEDLPIEVLSALMTILVDRKAV